MRSVAWRETAAGLRPESRATALRATGPWSRTVRRTVAAFVSRLPSPAIREPCGVLVVMGASLVTVAAV